MASETAKTTISVAIIIAGFIAIFALSGFLERHRPALPQGIDDEDLSLQGAKLKGFSLGFEGLIADWYWMRALQYIGNKLLNSPEQDIDLSDLRPLDPRLLYPYLDTATDLDPQFIPAYSYGAVVLPAIDPQKAIAITEKGIANNPDEWKLYHYLGFINWRLEQYDKAAEAYERGAKIPNAPPFMQLMAARMRTQGSSRETAREIYREMYEGAHDEQIRETAALQLLRLDSLDDLDAMSVVLSAFPTQNGHCAGSWQEIFAKLLNLKLPSGRPLNLAKTGIPVDPTGVEYLLANTGGACRIEIDYERSKIPRQ
jgi:tetratricopeptide (TPR) repeat protein